MSNQRSDFEIIRDEICELHQRWNLIEDLYTDESTIELLNECARTAFSVIFDAFVDLVIVGITRLVDQDQRALTLNSLARSYQGTQLGTSLARILKDVRRHSRPLVSHRNKRIAHHDADAAGSPSATNHSCVLPPITRKEIESCLQGIREFMNKITMHENRSTIYFERVMCLGDGKCLVQALRDSQRLNSLRDLAWRETDPSRLGDELKKWPDQYSDAG